VPERTELGRILRSPDFDASERARRFLCYIVDETLQGRADRIKAYSIATDVFRRDSSFDAHSDPIVRIEAGHLRRALEHYYLTAGKADPLLITIPKGTYVPKFAVRQPALVAPTASGQSSPQWRRLPLVIAALASIAMAVFLAVVLSSRARIDNPDIPRLLVKPFEDLSNVGNSHEIARGLTYELVGQIAKFKDIVTIEASEVESDARASEQPRYALVGAVDLTDDRVRLQVRVLRRTDGAVVWANSYVGDLRASKLIEIENAIADKVATALGQPYGIIFQADASLTPSNPAEDWTAYACTLSYYAYRANLDSKMHPAVRECLEKAVSRFPAYATAWALLSHIYTDEVRFHSPADPSSRLASIDRALAAARRAVELEPNNVRALEAELIATYFKGDFDAALKIGERALEVNPNDTELVGEFGFRLATAGNWSRGCAMIAQARERNQGPLGYYESGLATCSYFLGDYDQAMMWLKKASLPNNPIFHLNSAAIFGESGHTVEAAQERDWLMQHAPSLLASVRSELAMRIARPQDVERLIESLRKAGLPIPNKKAESPGG
jgi:TolB-like protein/Tfp pilus assembly protein PilF